METVSELIWERFHGTPNGVSDFETNVDFFQTLKIQLMALNLVDVTPSGHSVIWSLTEHGKSEMIRMRVVKV
jgi:hypothetical protein